MRSECGEIELLAGRPAAAEAFIRAACEELETMGNHGHYVTVAVGLGDALLVQGRLDEADALIDRIADLAIDDDLDPQVGWRRLKGRLLAQRGDFEEAVLVGSGGRRARRQQRLHRYTGRNASRPRRGAPPRGTPRRVVGGARRGSAALRAERQHREDREGSVAPRPVLGRLRQAPSAACGEAQTLDCPAAECEQQQAGDEQEDDQSALHERDTTTLAGRCHRPGRMILRRPCGRTDPFPAALFGA